MIRSIVSRLPIKVTAPVLLTVPVLVVVVVLVTVALIQGRSAVSHLASQKLAEVHGRIAERVDGLLHVPARINRINEHLIRDGKLDLRHVRDWRQTFFEEVEAVGVISSVTWGGENGDATWVARYPGDDYYTYVIRDATTGEKARYYRLNARGKIEGEPSKVRTYDPRSRPLYKAPKEAGKAAWSET